MDLDKNVKKARTLTIVGSLLLLSLMVNVSSADPDSDAAAPPPGVACPGFQRIDGMGPACPTADGLWEVFAPDGTSLGTTHGPDPVPSAPASEPTTAATGAVQPPLCVTDASDYHNIVIYARAHDDADRYASIAPQLRDEVYKANTHLRVDAGTYNVQADYKMLCSNGELEIRNVVLPTGKSSADFSTIVNDLRNLGYTNNKVKHWVWYDDTSACNCGGMGHVYSDDRLVADNYNNGHPSAIPMFAVTFGYMDYAVMMHESGHNLGAVQLSAPHSTGAWHCTDGRDIMCYNDGGSKGGQYRTVSCSGRTAFDCGHDDYFHPAPDSTSYLATKWNIGSTLNRFITYGPCGLAREGIVLAPGAGIYWRGVTAAQETGIPEECWGRSFVLQSTYASGDFDVCFYNGATRLACHLNAGDESGVIPEGTTEARITLYLGYLEQYTLLTP